MNDHPKISIVTPSYNQGEFLEQTICSVLDQQYPNLEYFVVDGGSTDQSVEIIKKYALHLNRWVSEKDNGQSHAINKSFAKATGTIYSWINSDDYYLPGAFEHAAQLYAESPQAVAWLGHTLYIDREGQKIKTEKPWGLEKSALSCWGVEGMIPQPGSFFSASAYHTIGGLREDLHYAMDVDFWIKLSTQGDFHTSNNTLAAFRVYTETKTKANNLDSFAETIACAIDNGELHAATRLLQYKLEREFDRGATGSLHDKTLLQALYQLISGRISPFRKTRSRK